MMLTYEEQRRQNIADNEALLKSLGLHMPVVPKATPKPKLKAKPKRQVVEAAEFEDKGSSSESDEEYTSSRPRRGARERRTTRSSVTSTTTVQKPFGRVQNGPRRRAASPESDDGQPLRKAQRLGVRTQEPKQFGNIPGIEVGMWWASRMDCSTDAVHAPTVAGISGNAELGAWSVALSGGYPDDVDLGDAFTYTGSGGRDLKGTRDKPKNLRTAPQTFDQSFENSYNAALKTSAETKNPVRVIRGFKLNSPYAPAEGYRYDGLYVVERAWMAPGLTKKLKVCKYAFKRLPGQRPLPRNDEETESDVGESEENGLDEEAADDVAGDHEAAQEGRNEAEVVTLASKSVSNETTVPAPESSSEFNETPHTRRSARAPAASEAPVAINGTTNGTRRSGRVSAASTSEAEGTSRRSSCVSSSITQAKSSAANGKRSGCYVAAEPRKRTNTRSSLPADTTLRRSRRSLA
ncbi:hypothetical protein CcaverHIS631_0101170 [Cutaneotrichosporon cavernicola]|nr:hypothetical protein CcaverHIS631_0101170 [Cutaneotrichosporon cavernicola]